MVKTMHLIYETTKAAVKLNDVVQSETLGQVTVTNVHAPRKKHGHGRVTLTLADGTHGDYSPSAIHAIWI
jgi:hypothetical protein